MAERVYTTGQMIDQLKVGEVAEAVGIRIKVAKNSMGGIGPVKNPGDNTVLNGVVVGAKWRILPKYVSFEEAMSALKDGKTVYCHPNWGSTNYRITPDEAKDYALSFLTIQNEGLINVVFENKWTIEEE
jgi:hypothetical protein